MFHLFDGILMLPDIAAVGGLNNNNIIISKFVDYDFGNTQSLIDVLKQPGYVETYCDTFDNLVGDGKKYATDQQFFEDLFANRPKEYRIFADCNAYETIVCKFLKAVFPLMDAETAYMIYKLSLDYFYLYYHFIRYRPVGLSLIDPSLSCSELVRHNHDHFVDTYSQICLTGDFTQLAEDVANFISTEFKLANWFADRENYSHIESLTRSIRELYTNALNVGYRDYQDAILPNVFRYTKENFTTNLVDCLNTECIQPFATQTINRKKHDVDNVIQSLKTILNNKMLYPTCMRQSLFMLDESSESAANMHRQHMLQLIDIIEKNSLSTYIDHIRSFIKTYDAMPRFMSRPDGINPLLLDFIIQMCDNKTSLEKFICK